MAATSTTTTTVLRVGGVPEHFNLPFHQAIETGAFAEAGLDVQWTDYTTGTGGMTKALSAGEQDVCIILTEGAVADILGNGSGNRIVGTHVSSPLTWGIHARTDSGIISDNDIQGKRYAVSRLLSGSHLMATVHAHQQGWATPIQPHRLVIANNIDGARASMSRGDSDVFLWEKYTTKYVVDSGEWARVGEVVTPWPCFVVAASASCLRNKSQCDALKVMMSVMAKVCISFMENEGDKTVATVADRCGLSVDDAREWFSSVRVGTRPSVQRQALKDVIKALKAVNVIRGVDPPLCPPRQPLGPPDDNLAKAATAKEDDQGDDNEEDDVEGGFDPESLLASFTSLE